MILGVALFIGIVILCLAALISWEDTRRLRLARHGCPIDRSSWCGYGFCRRMGDEESLSGGSSSGGETAGMSMDRVDSGYGTNSLLDSGDDARETDGLLGSNGESGVETDCLMSRHERRARYGAVQRLRAYLGSVPTFKRYFGLGHKVQNHI
jgi:hypothetical protein